MLIVGAAALVVSMVIGGSSYDVPTYIVGALALGVFFAMYTGTMESVVYDTVLEVTGSGEAFQRHFGRVRLTESASMVSSALLGGWLAGFTGTRATHWLTVPFVAASIIALVWFRQPRVHEAAQPSSLREHLATTYTTLVRRIDLLPVVLLAVLTALIPSTLFEFGPLWLVALSAAAVVYGPFWAGLVSTLGLGGLIAEWLRLDRPAALTLVVPVLGLSAWALTASRSLLVLTIAQVTLLLLVVALGIHTTQRLHDAVLSSVRSSVASGVGGLSWMVFVPFALGFGSVSNSSGVHAAGWLIVAVVVVTAVVAFRVFSRRPDAPKSLVSAGDDSGLRSTECAVLPVALSNEPAGCAAAAEGPFAPALHRVDATPHSGRTG